MCACVCMHMHVCMCAHVCACTCMQRVPGPRCRPAGHLNSTRPGHSSEGRSDSSKRASSFAALRAVDLVLRLWGLLPRGERRPTGALGAGPGGGLPAVREEAAADVPGPVAPGRGARHALCLDRLPGELGAVEVAVLLPLGRQGAPRRAAVGRILAGDVALAVTPGDWASSNRSKTHFTVLPAQTWWPLRQRQGNLPKKVTLSASKGERRKEVHRQAPPGGRGAGAGTGTGHAGRRGSHSGADPTPVGAGAGTQERRTPLRGGRGSGVCGKDATAGRGHSFYGNAVGGKLQGYFHKGRFINLCFLKS